MKQLKSSLSSHPHHSAVNSAIQNPSGPKNATSACAVPRVWPFARNLIARAGDDIARLGRGAWPRKRRLNARLSRSRRWKMDATPACATEEETQSARKWNADAAE